MDDKDVFKINTEPTNNEHYNKIHTRAEKIVTSLVRDGLEDGAKVIGMFRTYRDVMIDVFNQVNGDVNNEQFVSTVKHAANDRGSIGGLEDEILSSLDTLFIDIVKTENCSPKKSVLYFSEYVDRITEKYESMYNIEGTF